MKKFYISNTGCNRRAIESQKIFDYLILNDWKNTKDISAANLIIISTCGVKEENEDYSLNIIKECIRKKKSDSCKVIVCGCLSKINPEKIKKFGAITLIGPRELEKFDEIADAKIKFKDMGEKNIIKNEKLLKSVYLNSKITKNEIIIGNEKIPYDFLPNYNISISQGCLGDCSYCAIKNATGKLKSKPVKDIIHEFKKGLNEDYKIFNIVAEDVGCYGQDIGTNIVFLLEKMCEIEGNYTLKLKDFNPQWFIRYNEKLTDLLLRNESKIDEILIPIQSASDRILNMMKRPYHIEEINGVIKYLNQNLPTINIRTAVIIGFPGELEVDFHKTKNFISKLSFSEIIVNKYSDRPNTESSKMKNKIPQEKIEERFNEVMKIINEKEKSFRK